VSPFESEPYLTYIFLNCTQHLHGWCVAMVGRAAHFRRLAPLSAWSEPLGSSRATEPSRRGSLQGLRESNRSTLVRLPTAHDF